MRHKDTRRHHKEKEKKSLISSLSETRKEEIQMGTQNKRKTFIWNTNGHDEGLEEKYHFLAFPFSVLQSRKHRETKN
jgi:hypothetical protein